MAISFKETDDFRKDFKKLAKKYKSLADDLELFKNIIAKNALGIGAHFKVITRKDNLVIIKARLFCRYLKGSSLRIIYAYFEENGSIEIIQIFEFIEVYFKGQAENEDCERIERYLKNNYE